MKEFKGDRLYVNLGASQVRRRLKGYGFGVKKIESAGKNQAVIIHTATGQHLRELERLFADASPCQSSDQLGRPIENLRNLGPASARWLKEVGVHTEADLRRFGAAVAFRLVKQRQPAASLNLLWALAAALAGKDWRDLSSEEKAILLEQIQDPGD